MTNGRFTYRVTWSEKDQEYVGLCTELPSLSWLAVTPEAALKGIRRVVSDVVADMKENGELVPEPIIRPRYCGNFEVVRQDVAVGLEALERGEYDEYDAEDVHRRLAKTALDELTGHTRRSGPRSSRIAVGTASL